MINLDSTLFLCSFNEDVFDITSALYANPFLLLVVSRNGEQIALELPINSIY